MDKKLTLLFIKFYKFFLILVHILGRISGKYYFEDYLRVYPDSITYYPFGFKRKASKGMVNNFLNHSKFYFFASQFVKEKVVADVGCGSGYGAEILKKGGAKKISGCDISKHSINFAKKRYGKIAEFKIQGITDLKYYPDNFFDVTICGEVLEHIAEYGMEDVALRELKRITKEGGLIIIGTPNNEIIEGHGFSYTNINKLFKNEFKQYYIFENALIPFGNRKRLWMDRLKNGRVGIIISELINKSEVPLEEGENPEFKSGLKARKYKFGKISINTALLHNTHSWIIVAIKNS